MSEKIINVSGYGLFCLSITSFTEFLRVHKLRAKKLNAFFDKNRDLLEQAIQTGSWLPVATINSIEYLVEVGTTADLQTFGKDWQEVLCLANCNLRVGADAAVWVGTLDTLDAWNPTEYGSKESISYQTMDGETLFSAYKFDVEPSAYKVTLRGFKRRQALDYPAANYGFAYELHPADNFDSFANPLVEEVNIARM
ncbi:hypothetical protein QMK33_22535 [Hymenobacter sp. H14-R3]|uniref:hypothetical protein n=1 Tax=Hymenobacter sp. H14-R3 TaxID=3046308 RepID=UPI0024B8D585|nr:hypothetical protein [Hymenobacter sp. H14-R3]MDJ0367929.1 hypothetical protein [Hymenobacter sp. H14-R3]